MNDITRRYEILLPRRFNNGSSVPGEVFATVLVTLRERFGAVSAERQTIRGEWEHEGHVYEDWLVRVFVDVPDTAEHREWFRAFKERLKRDFQQLDIWITTHPIEVL